MQGTYPKPDRKGSPAKNFSLGIVVAAAVAALLVAAYTLGFDRGKPNEPPKTAQTPAPSGGGKSTSGGGEDKSKELFASSCGSCHTLKAAGTTGVQGPNLDDIKPAEKATVNQIAKGGGGMPAGLLKGEDAKSVAKYVSSVAGK